MLDLRKDVDKFFLAMFIASCFGLFFYASVFEMLTFEKGFVNKLALSVFFLLAPFLSLIIIQYSLAIKCYFFSNKNFIGKKKDSLLVKLDMIIGFLVICIDMFFLGLILNVSWIYYYLGGLLIAGLVIPSSYVKKIDFNPMGLTDKKKDISNYVPFITFNNNLLIWFQKISILMISAFIFIFLSPVTFFTTGYYVVFGEI